jgi:hypothetical protein
MNKRVDSNLSPELFDYLQDQHPFIVITNGGDGWPCAEMVSWIVAIDLQTIRMVIGSQRQSVSNLRSDSSMTLQLIGPGLSYEIKGMARLIKERCESLRFPQTMIELKVESIRGNMYPANTAAGDIPVSWPESTNEYHDQWNQSIAEEMRRFDEEKRKEETRCSLV